MIRGLLSQLNQWHKGTPRNHINWLYHTPRWFTDLCFRIGWACHCGSGGHPRRCNKHPWAYQQHCDELNHDGLSREVDELREELEIRNDMEIKHADP